MGEELRELLGQVDDDYLTGLSNKGILKRAYKDLEQESPVADWQQEGAQVKLGGETCVIRAPLGESTCTCPSRSMCRHIVTAVLWLKGNPDAGGFGGTETKEAGGFEESGDSEGAKGTGDTKETGEAEGAGKARGTGDTEGIGKTKKTGETKGLGKTKETEETKGTGNTRGTGKNRETGSSRAPEKARFSEFFELPLERLVKVCGANHFRRFLAHVRTEGLPPVEAGSIVTVELPWEQAVVKLLEPLSYSSCTCHSKGFCTHKAQALLAWRLREGACTLQELETGQEVESVLDQEQVREVCESLREAVMLQLCTGLSRQSPEASVSMERLAVISHRAGLADMERSLRGAAEEYTQYFERQARFREEELLDRLLEMYRLAGQIQKAENIGVLQKLAGSFRDTYEFAGRLRLIGIGSRAFKSKAGYEGEIYYFLNEADGRYLTWTDARPTFYEGTGRKQNAQKYSQAPWGLGCSRKQLFEMQLELADARLAPGGRLSASQETKGEILGQKSICDEGLRERIVWDYRKLLEIIYAPGEHGTDDDGAYDDGSQDRKRERMTLLGAVRWGEAAFDKILQRFSWELFDTEGRRIYVSLKYTKEEKLIIGLLERMEKKVRRGKYASVVLFGSLYLEDGRLCLYPVEFWLQKEEGLPRACGQEITEDKAQQRLPSKEALDIMEQYLKETGRHLADLFVSGLRSSSEELERRIRACAQEGEELGLHYAGEKLAKIAELLEERRHRMEFSPEPLLEVWEGLQRYLKVCERKVSFDRARLSVEADENSSPPMGRSSGETEL